MKKPITIMFTSLTILLGANKSLVATPVNPVEWDFSVSIYGTTSLPWSSYTNITPTYPQYNYAWELTKVENLIMGFWFDVTKNISLSERSGSGTIGQLPCNNEKIMHIGLSPILMDLMLDIDSQGRGKVRIDNSHMLVDGAHFEGNLTVTGVVPEPATIALLGMGTLAMLKSRRKLRSA